LINLQQSALKINTATSVLCYFKDSVQSFDAAEM